MTGKCLLSICIPTYNRAEYLYNSLSVLLGQIQNSDPVEVIVSDNCSTDATQEVIKVFSSHSKLKVVRQPRNVGPIKNGLDLIAVHSRGEFCWFLGDDDYLLKGGLASVLNFLTTHDFIDFLFVNVDRREIDNLNVHLANVVNFVDSKPAIQHFDFQLLSRFEDLLDPKYSPYFLAELMASIFRRTLWLEGSGNMYSFVNEEYLSSLETSYGHCVVFANSFMGKKAAYISTPIVLVDNRARNWSEKTNYLLVEQLFSLLKLYEKKGLQGKVLQKCKSHYITMTLPIFLSFLFKINSKYRKNISFFRYFIFLFLNIRISFFAILQFLKKRILNSLC